MRKTSLVIGCALCACAFVLNAGARGVAQRQFSVKGTEAILIKLWPYSRYKGADGDEALLITDPKEISEFVRLLDGNSKSAEFRCGYDWELIFRKSARESEWVYFNEKCDTEFARDTEAVLKLFRTHFDSIRSGPKFFITSVELPAAVAPDEALKLLESEPRQRVFFLTDPNKRFPSVRLTKASENYSAAAEKEGIAEVGKAISALKTKYRVVSSTEPTYESVLGEVRGVKATVYFQLGTKMEGLGRVLDGVQVDEVREPESYFVQLVSPAKSTEESARKLKEKYPFIKKAQPYSPK